MKTRVFVSSGKCSDVLSYTGKKLLSFFEAETFEEDEEKNDTGDQPCLLSPLCRSYGAALIGSR